MNLLDETIASLEQEPRKLYDIDAMIAKLGGDLNARYTMPTNNLLLYFLCLSLRRLRDEFHGD